MQYTAVFTLLLYKYVFLQLLQYCWNLPFCVSVFLSVFCQILVFHGWHSIGILVKLGLGNIFDTPLAAPHIFLLIALLLTQLPKSIPFWHTQGGLREDIKYYFADFVCKGEGGRGGPPQIRNSFLAKNVVCKGGERGTPPNPKPFFDLKNRCIWAKNTILTLFEDKLLGKCP